MMTCLNRSREYKGLQQKVTGLSLVAAGDSKISTHYLSTESETAVALWRSLKKLASDFSRGSGSVNAVMSVHMLATMPNQSFSSAIDITMIKADNMLMNPKPCFETQAILDDKEIMGALARADCQYNEGKAKSLRNLIVDLGFEVDALLD